METTESKKQAFHEAATSIMLAADYFMNHPDVDMDEKLLSLIFPVLNKIPMLNGYGEHMRLMNFVEKEK